MREVVARVEGLPGLLVAEVCTPDFARVEEAARQEGVWDRLLAELSDLQGMEVETVVTRVPGEGGGEGEKGWTEW